MSKDRMKGFAGEDYEEGDDWAESERGTNKDNEDWSNRDIEYFKKKLYRSLNVPMSRLEADNGFNMGRASEISRDELKFNKFIKRLQAKFARCFTDILRTQLVLKNLVSGEEFDAFKDFIYFGEGDDETRKVVLADMNQDGFDDIIAVNVGDKNFIYFGDKEYQFKSFLPFGRSVDKTMALAVGDLNQDGKLDIVVGNNNQSNQYYINNGSACLLYTSPSPRDRG